MLVENINQGITDGDNHNFRSPEVLSLQQRVGPWVREKNHYRQCEYDDQKITQ